MINKRVLVIAVRTLLRPIVRLMIGLGFNARDFMEVTKVVYTEIATKEYGKRGRDANVSRVALLTGLTRREIAKLRKVSIYDPLEIEDPMVPVGRVLSAWHQEPRFQDANGEPKPLPLKTTFADLVNEHRCDIPAIALIKELEEHDSIKIRNGMVTVKSRYFMPFQLDANAIERFGRVMGDMANAITSNLLESDREQASFEGRAVHEYVSTSTAEAFRKFLDRRAQELLEEVDDWLSDHSQPAKTDRTRLGVGIYTIKGMY